MKFTHRYTDQGVYRLLGFLVLFDTVLVLWATVFHRYWFLAFHGVEPDDPQGFLYRCAANWAAFLLFQAIAFVRWREQPVWLAVVGGVRLSDIFTDFVYFFAAAQTTWWAQLTLPTMGLFNLWMGFYLMGAAQRRLGHVPATK